MKLYKIIALSIAFSLCLPAYAQNVELIQVKAKVLGIGDRNTILVERLDKPGTKINIQLRGLQLAHRNGRCDFERKLADETANTISRLIGGENVTLRNAAPDIDKHTAEADVFNSQGVDIGQYLLYHAVLAHPTDTGTLADWCGKEGKQ